jgi:uncharacterized protein YkwD
LAPRHRFVTAVHWYIHAHATAATPCSVFPDPSRVIPKDEGSQVEAAVFDLTCGMRPSAERLW